MPTSRVGSSARRPARRPAAGFTLLEILITIAILGLVSALAAPAIASRLLETPLDHSARLLAGMLQEARARAAVRAEPVAVLWSPEGRRFTLRGAKGEHVLALPPAMRVEARGLVTGLPGMPAGRQGIVFFPLGGSTGGSITLRSSAGSATLRADPIAGTVQTVRER
jgi:general secretion pathway protein H